MSQARTAKPANPKGALLYHYTSAEALGQILHTEKLRFTRADCVNDPNEWIAGVQFVKDAFASLARRRSRLGLEQQHKLILYEMVGETRFGMAHVFDVPPYIFSLCEDGDNPILWRLYTMPLGGVAIGFDKARLLGSVGPWAQLDACKYHTAKQATRRIEEHMLTRVKESVAANKTAIGAPAQQILTELLAQIPFIKDRSFKDENEHRIVTRNFSGEQFIRADGGWVRIFTELKIDRKDIREVVVGPGRYHQENFNALKSVRGLKVIQSKFQVRSTP